LRFALGFQQLNGDVVEPEASIGTNDVREAALRVPHLARAHNYVNIRFARLSANEISGVETDIDIWPFMLMEQCSLTSLKTSPKNGDISVFK
jgi:hypothetical protein